jgi:hypothetical protein
LRAVFGSPTRPFISGAASSVRPSRTGCVTVGLGQAIQGHLDEVFIKIQGKNHYLWRAVDQDGVVLDILVTSRRDAKAATRFFHKLLKGLRFVPRALITDKLAAQYREEMNTRFTTWNQVVGLPHRRLTHPPHSHILGLRTARHTPAAST